MGELVISAEVPEEPFNGGHVVLRLNKSIFDLSADELIKLKSKVDAIITVEKSKMRPEGFNIHILDREIHIIPRWCGDINVAFFGGVKVVPLSPDDVRRLVIDEIK
jgi:ATP adenylyltransferase